MVLLASLLALAIVDSINPSALLVTLALLARPRPMRTVPIYVGAVAATYFGLGALTMLGLGSVRQSLAAALESQIGFVVQALVGVAMLAWSLRTPKPDSAAAPAQAPTSTNTLALIALGIAVTFLELPTALPYAGAIALLVAEGLPTSRWLPLLGAYNLVFVAPPLLLLALHRLVHDRVALRFADLRARLERGAIETARWIAGLVGGALAITSVIEFVARWR
jgi:putative Mn2+ efflux pump MntP